MLGPMSGPGTASIDVPSRVNCALRCLKEVHVHVLITALHRVEQGRRRLHRRWLSTSIGGRCYNHACFRCENERGPRGKAEVADVNDGWPNVTCPNSTSEVNESLLSSSLGQETGLLTL